MHAAAEQEVAHPMTQSEGAALNSHEEVAQPNTQSVVVPPNSHDAETGKGDEVHADKEAQPATDASVDQSNAVNDLCEICKSTKHKYKCPRCGVKTCSLTCVKQHKEKASCTGERDKTKFVPIKKFSEKELISDLKFLESISRTSDNARRTGSGYGVNMNRVKNKDVGEAAESSSPQSKKRRRNTKGSRFDRLPMRLKQLVLKAEERGVELLLMPLGMSKRTKNTSNYNKETDQMVWKLEVHICASPNVKPSQQNPASRMANSLGLGEVLSSHVFDAINENESLKSVVSKCLEEAKCKESVSDWTEEMLDAFTKDESQCSLLTESQDGDVDSLKPQLQSRPTRMQLNLEQTVKENLVGKTVVEYPIVFISKRTNLE